MTIANMERLKHDITTHEGVRLTPYRDSVGKLTIGVGRNLDDRGLTPAEVDFLLDNDIAIAIEDARVVVDGFDRLSVLQQEGVVEMAFNLGRSRLSTFKRMIAALNRGDGAAAAREALDSRWAAQVGGNRANAIADKLKG